jgi:hypothetical protein
MNDWLLAIGVTALLISMFALGYSTADDVTCPPSVLESQLMQQDDGNIYLWREGRLYYVSPLVAEIDTKIKTVNKPAEVPARGKQ